MILAGRQALVTGGTSGIGQAIAAGLLDAGAHVAIAGIDSGAVAEAAASLSHGNGRVSTSVADLSSPAQVADLASSVADELGGIDILVNNAGVRSVHSFLEHPRDDWEHTLAVNLTAPFLLSQAVAPHMIERGKGKILNITSIAAELAMTNRLAYNVSKAGLAMLTKSIALEMGKYGICCNAIAPGIVETSLNRHYFEDEDLAAAIVAATPVARWGQPSELVGAAVFLCSDAADFINGSTLLVDGGWSTGKGY